MEKLITLALILWCAVPAMLQADDGIDQGRLTEAEFRARQQAYITERAGLTEEESERFFTLYFELEDKKKELNDTTRKLNLRGRDQELTEAEYKQILEQMNDARQQAERLEQEYYKKFTKILTYKKIFLVQRAEMSFHMEMVKGMKPGGGKGPGGRDGHGGERPPR